MYYLLSSLAFLYWIQYDIVTTIYFTFIDTIGIFWQKVCFGLLTLLFVSTCFLWLGNGSLIDSFHKVGDSIQSLQDFFNSIDVDTNSTIMSAGSVTNTATIVCAGDYSSYTNQLNSFSDTLVSSANSITDLINPINDSCDTFQSIINVGIRQKNVLVFVFFFLLSALLATNGLIVFAKMKFLVYFTNPILYVFILASLVLCSVLMIFCMVLGEFCGDPAGNMLGRNLQCMTHLAISTCSGNSNFASYLDSMYSVIN